VRRGTTGYKDFDTCLESSQSELLLAEDALITDGDSSTKDHCRDYLKMMEGGANTGDFTSEDFKPAHQQEG
jgi:hypothetical protein